MAKKVKKLTAKEAIKLIEEIRSSCAAAVEQESSADAGDFTIEELEKAIGKNWETTKVELK